MKLFICNCGNEERLPFYPDCCSYCLREMKPSEDCDAMRFPDQEQTDFTLTAAYLGFEQGSVLLWQREGRTISQRHSNSIDRLLAENRFSQLMQLYGVPA